MCAHLSQLAKQLSITCHLPTISLKRELCPLPSPGTDVYASDLCWVISDVIMEGGEEAERSEIGREDKAAPDP